MTLWIKHMEWMSKEVQNGHFLLCPNGHLAQYDDQKIYFKGLYRFKRRGQRHF
jgi:proline iminopeptidase